MAKLEYIVPAEDKVPASVETIEIRPWGPVGRRDQVCLIGNGVNFNARDTHWMEIIYSVQGIPVFYTRNFLHDIGSMLGRAASYLDKFIAGEMDAYGFGGMLPETGFTLKREKYMSQINPTGDGKECSYYKFEIAIDMGVMFDVHAGPGQFIFKLEIPIISLEKATDFLRELEGECALACQGKHPDPARLPQHASEWPFALQLNRKAYQVIAQDYQEHYFANIKLRRQFDAWLNEIPAGAHILDAGCGHGNPIIGYLLERNYLVTGLDLSPAMMERARKQYPAANYINLPVMGLESEATFDAACSFSSLLYLDPIDLVHSIYRLYRALKSGGLLFLFGYDIHPSYRGLPYDTQLDQWMWSWTHSMKEATHILEEHGYFKVIKTHNVTTAGEKRCHVERWRKQKQEEYEKSLQNRPPDNPPPSPPDLTRPPKNLAYGYIIIAQRTG